METEINVVTSRSFEKNCRTHEKDTKLAAYNTEKNE